jgi:hypothetical protein
MKIKRPILLKMILTPILRTKLEDEYKSVIRTYEHELEQLDFQSRKLLHDSSKKGSDAHKIIHDRLKHEEKLRKEKIAQHHQLLNQLAKIPEGNEIVHSELEGEVEVKVGERWDKLINKLEIVVKDDMIIEIRDGVEKE